MERRFARQVGSLEAVFAFVDEFAAAHSINRDQSYDLALIIEELFTNMVRHARGGGEQISIDLEREEARVAVTLRDFDVEPFDVTRVKALDTNAPLSERRAGGMGLHFVKRLTDGMSYDYRDRTSTIKVMKRLEP